MTDSDHEKPHDEREVEALGLSLPLPQEQRRFWVEKGGSRYRLAIYSLIAIILGPLSLWLLKRFLTGDAVLLSLRAIKPWPLVGALTFLAISWSSRLMRVWYLFRPLAKRISYRDFVKSYFAGVFASQITPSAVGGYPFFLFLLYRQGIPAGRSLAISLLDSVNTGLAFLLLLTGGVLSFRTHIPEVKGWLPSAMVGMGLLTGAALALLLFPQTLQRLAYGLSQESHGLVGKLAPWATQASKELERLQLVTLYFWSNHRLLLILNFILNLVYWVAYLAVAPLLFLAVGGKAPWPMIVGSQIATQFAQYLIPTPGAAGGAEVTMALLVHTLLPEEKLVLFLGLWRFCTYYISLIGTSLTIPWVLRLLRSQASGRDGEEAPKAPQPQGV